MVVRQFGRHSTRAVPGGKLRGMKDNGFNISYDWLLEIIASQPTIKSIPLKGKKNQITKNKSFEAERT